MAFNPAALVSQLHDGEQHVLDRGGIILHGEAFVPVRVDPPGEHADRRRGGFRHGRIDDFAKPLQDGGIVHGDQARGLPVAAGRRVQAGLHNGFQVGPRDGRGLVFSPVAVTAADRVQNVHSDISFFG